jgi:hypothetical protein
MKEKINNTKIQDIVSILTKSNWKESLIKECILDVLKEEGFGSYQLEKLENWMKGEIKNGHSLESIVNVAKQHYPSYVIDYLSYYRK